MKYFNKYTYLIIVVIALLLLYQFNPTQYWFWPKCAFKLLTGLNCPACGIQRFVHALLQGDFMKACQYNYYLLYALPYVLVIVFIYYLPKCKLKLKLKEIFEGKIAVWLYVVTFFAWFVVRNLLDI